MAVYCAIVHVWRLWITPLGPDAERLAGEAGLTGPAAWALAAAARVFGGAALPYHLVSVALIYLCMLCVYLLVNRLTQAPSWLGVFAANLWMASPGHREATVALTGMVDLLPCAVALMAIVAFMAHDARPGTVRLALLAVFIAAALAFPVNQWIGAVLLLFGLISKTGGAAKAARTVLCLVAVVAGLLLHPGPSLETATLFDRYGALYFSFYGIGLLPESAERFATHPWLGWLAAALVGALLGLAHRKAARPAFVVTILAMLVHRSSGAVQPVDPVHLVGGGSLVFATALFMIGVAVLYARSMEHKRWAPVLGLTSITASVVFFLLMINAIFPWREAARLTQTYHEAAIATHAETGAPVAVVPDFQAMRGAPLQLSALLSHDTPFGPAVPHAAALPLDYAPMERAAYTLMQDAGQPPRSVVIGGPDARALQRPWEGRALGTRITDFGYVIDLPDGLALRRRNWVPFGEVMWVFADPPRPTARIHPHGNPFTNPQAPTMQSP